MAMKKDNEKGRHKQETKKDTKKKKNKKTENANRIVECKNITGTRENGRI